MAQLQLRVVSREHLRDDSAPQTRGGEDVGLVGGDDLQGGVVLEGEGGADVGDALDFGAGVGPDVGGEVGLVDFGAEVGAAAVFSYWVLLDLI